MLNGAEAGDRSGFATSGGANVGGCPPFAGGPKRVPGEGWTGGPKSPLGPDEVAGLAPQRNNFWPKNKFVDDFAFGGH